jgi:hypothetical protein
MNHNFITEENDPARTIPGEFETLVVKIPDWFSWKCICGMRIKTTDASLKCPYCQRSFEEQKELRAEILGTSWDTRTGRKC